MSYLIYPEKYMQKNKKKHTKKSECRLLHMCDWCFKDNELICKSYVSATAVTTTIVFFIYNNSISYPGITLHKI